MASYNEYHNKILREYDNTQLQNKHALEMRRKEIYAAIPKIKVLNDEIVSIAIESGRLALMGNQTALENLKTNTNNILKQQEELLTLNGYPKDYLTLRHKCNICKDTGYVNNSKCNCFRQAVADLVYTGSNLKQILNKENFDNFRFDFYSNDIIDEIIKETPRNNMQKIVSYVKGFINDFEHKKDNLLLMGNTGVGKTFLANCIAKELLDKGFIVVYLTAFRLFDILERYKFNKDQAAQYNIHNQFKYILDCDLLIIDDLGTELNNSFITSQLYLIINERLLRQKSTVISTNLSLELLIQNYSERIYSRISSNYSVRRIVGEDIRLYKVLNDIDTF
ncbi:MAG TPA: ATP-binding protein [Clostridiales bacterium]|nr:ATP-binding protein [Clostridiales bacterium]